jgi:hypothetical protein
MILVGDPAQFSPVKGSALHDDKNKNEFLTHGFNMYNQFNIVIQLTQQMKISNNVKI